MILSHNNLRSIPKDIGNLSKLVHLEISNNILESILLDISQT